MTGAASDSANMPDAAIRSDIVDGRPEPLTRAVSRFIHLARWVAALVVVLHHVSTTFVSVPDIMTAPHNPLAYVWWFFTPYVFAHEAVVVFFVLSGFLVGGAVATRRKQETPWLRDYTIDRFVRIYIVFLPALALTFSLDATGRALFPNAAIYDLEFLHGRFSPALILPNLLSLQGLWAEPLGTNLALWSLGMEMWFYLLFPLLLMPWMRAYSRHGTRVFGLAAALFFLLALPEQNYMPIGFAIWGLGVLARIMPRPAVRSKWLALALFVVVSVVVRLAIREHIVKVPPVKYIVDMLEGLLFANLLMTLRFDQGKGFRWARPTLHATIASFSFTLYAFHTPLVFWLAGLVGTLAGPRWRLEQATGMHYAVAIGIIAFILVIAWGLSLMTEAHTEHLRRAARRFLTRRSPKAA